MFTRKFFSSVNLVFACLHRNASKKGSCESRHTCSSERAFAKVTSWNQRPRRSRRAGRVAGERREERTLWLGQDDSRELASTIERRASERVFAWTAWAREGNKLPRKSQKRGGKGTDYIRDPRCWRACNKENTYNIDIILIVDVLNDLLTPKNIATRKEFSQNICWPINATLIDCRLLGPHVFWET